MRGWGIKPGDGVEKEKASSNAANQSYLTLPDVVEVSMPRSCGGALLGYAPNQSKRCCRAWWWSRRRRVAVSVSRTTKDNCSKRGPGELHTNFVLGQVRNEHCFYAESGTFRFLKF